MILRGQKCKKRGLIGGKTLLKATSVVHVRISLQFSPEESFLLYIIQVQFKYLFSPNLLLFTNKNGLRSFSKLGVQNLGGLAF